jgi:hypothetical protein
LVAGLASARSTLFPKLDKGLLVLLSEESEIDFFVRHSRIMLPRNYLASSDEAPVGA